MNKQEAVKQWRDLVSSGDLRQAIGLFLLEFGNPEMTMIEVQEMVEVIFNRIVGVKNE